MRGWLKIVVDTVRQIGYPAAPAAGVCREAVPVIKRVVRMVRRLRLWSGSRKRPKVTRQWVGSVRLDLEYSKRTGYRLVAWAIMEVRGQVRAAGRTWSVDVPKKPADVGSVSPAARQAAPKPSVLSKTPVLASFLLDMQYEDGGGPREPSYLLLRAAGGEWLATLKDPTEARQIRLRVTDLGTVYAALEALLAGDSCPWEPDVWTTQRKGRKPGSR